jgi:ubiquinone/menaquinone biosynthesis C-methylase UbiE
MARTAPQSVSPARGHPIFARVFDRLSRLVEKEAGVYRDELVAGLHGRVLEVGAGNGTNFSRYPSTVDGVVALEPEAYLRRKAEAAARDTSVRVSVLGGRASPLPFEDGSFDAAVASLVLCTVPDPADALGELRRVLKPGGELRFMEHVRAEGPLKSGVQRWLDRGLWPHLLGGCHCARDTVSAIQAAGYRLERVRSYSLGPSWIVANPHVIGSARAPGA